MAPTPTAFPANLRAARKAKGWSMDQLAAAAETSKGYISDLERGARPTPPGRTLERFAAALDTTVDALVGPTPSEGAGSTIVQPEFLPVRYKVAAGVWFENELEEPPVSISYPVVPDPRFANWPQWLELVEGDSVNKKIQPGHFAHVVDAIAMGYAPKDKHWVVVERRRGGGGGDFWGLRERTIKQVEISGGRILLCPRSTNPKWSEPISLTSGAKEGEAIQVQVVGLVIGSYDPDY